MLISINLESNLIALNQETSPSVSFPTQATQRLWDAEYTELPGLEGLHLDPESFTQDMFQAASRFSLPHILRTEGESINAMVAQLINRILQCYPHDDFTTILARERHFSV